MDHQQDIEIIEQIRQGDHRQYRILVDRYKIEVFNLAIRILKNKEDAEDVAQEAFVKAFQALNKFNNDAKFTTWLYRIVYNTAIDKVRKNKKSPVDIAENPAQLNKDLMTNNNQGLVEKDRQKFIRQAIESLENDEQVLVSLFYEQEKDMREIGEIMHLSHANVRTKMSRLRKKLKVYLQSVLNNEVTNLI